MDNASYHNVQDPDSKAPTSNSRKAPVVNVNASKLDVNPITNSLTHQASTSANKELCSMSGQGSKKLINSVERCVDDMLEGYVALNPGVRLLQGHRIVIRADVEDYVKSGKVAVLCGGGSGHEPAQSGYVGRGYLTAFVAGAVFASPPPQEILPAIRAVAKRNKGGCLLSVANYTGDRLNFGLAYEKARQEGIKIAMIVVGEDCAVTTNDRTAGRRGLVGYAVTNKIAGALAEMGRSLEDIVEITTAATKQMGTIGLSWSACSAPGSGPTFSLGDDEMELGLGAHGEAGVKRMKMTSAREAVKIMIDHITNPDNPTYLKVTKGDHVAIFINNLGATTVMEMNIVVGEAISYLESMGMHVARAYSSRFITSMEMAGISITLLRLDKTLTQALDYPTDSPHWPRPLLPHGVTDRQTPPRLVLHYIEDTPSATLEGGAKVESDYAGKLFEVIAHVSKKLIENEARLNQLDTEGGDGDTGSTLARGARAILKQLGNKDNPGLPVDKPSSLVQALATTAENQMGGASGALHSLLLTSSSSCLKDSVTVTAWRDALSHGIDAVRRYGGAEPGDRTMLDPLCAARDVLLSRLSETTPIQAFTEAVQAAQKTAEATATMRAYAGRASYVNPDRLTQPDPGATGVAIWLRAILERL
ncbi:triokinase/FMN cyclase-like isoform X1 [Haliotis asinina]|uniref:triokinase/FMN cyclase-like isoform X1 n=1 Tax=Haliotis asinina TaxID=109174 RepID=UPI00353257FE